jgi:hypothetical protein
MIVEPIITTHGGLRQEDNEFKTRLGYIARPYLKKKCFKAQ